MTPKDGKQTPKISPINHPRQPATPLLIINRFVAETSGRTGFGIFDAADCRAWRNWSGLGPGTNAEFPADNLHLSAITPPTAWPWLCLATSAGRSCGLPTRALHHNRSPGCV